MSASSRGSKIVRRLRATSTPAIVPTKCDLSEHFHELLEILFDYALAVDSKLAIALSKAFKQGSQLMDEALDSHTNDSTPSPMPLTTRRRRMSSKLNLCIECGRPATFTRVVGVIESGMVCETNFCNYYCRSSEVFLGGFRGLSSNYSVRKLADLGWSHPTFTHDPQSFDRSRRFMLAVNRATVVRAFIVGRQMWRMEEVDSTSFREIYDIHLTTACPRTELSETFRVLLSPSNACVAFNGWNKGNGVVDRLNVKALIDWMSDCRLQGSELRTRAFFVKALAFMGEKIERCGSSESILGHGNRRKPAISIRYPTHSPCNHNYANEQFLWRCSNCGFHRTKSGVKFTR